MTAPDLGPLHVRNVDRAVWRRFRAHAVRGNVDVGLLLTRALDDYLSDCECGDGVENDDEYDYENMLHKPAAGTRKEAKP